MEKDLRNPFIIGMLSNINDETRKKELVNIIEDIPQSILIPVKDIGSYSSNIQYLNNNDCFWNIPYLIELNSVDRPIFSITKDDILDTMLNPMKSDVEKLVYFYMIFRHKKRHYGL